jgi:hypothetical protein
MKNFTICLMSALALLCMFSFKMMYDVRSQTAEVNQLEGIYIFTDSKPIKEYEVLGSIKVGFAMGSEKYAACRDRLISKAKKEYPAAQAIIVQDGLEKADVLKFK